MNHEICGTLISAASVWLVLIPLIAAQYVLAIFCLTRLAYCKLSVAKYVAWNVFILLVFFVGSGVFLIYYYANKQRLRADTQDFIKIDTTDGEEQDGIITGAADGETSYLGPHQSGSDGQNSDGTDKKPTCATEDITGDTTDKNPRV